MESEVVEGDRFLGVGESFERDGEAGHIGEDILERRLVGPKGLGGDAAGEAGPLAVWGADGGMKQILLEGAAAARDR